MLSGSKSWSMRWYFFSWMFWWFFFFYYLFELLFRILLNVIKTLILATKFWMLWLRLSPISSLWYLLQTGSISSIFLSLILKYYLLWFCHFYMFVLVSFYFTGTVIFIDVHKLLFGRIFTKINLSFIFIKRDHLLLWIALWTWYQRVVTWRLCVSCSDETFFT